MNPADYQAFTQQLIANLQEDTRVFGLVAAGSMAEGSHMPDEWSDHDFFVIVESGQQEDFRQNLAWLPDADKVVHASRETEHGLKVLYQNGHLLEFAIFDPQELFVIKVNDYRVLFDKTTIADDLVKIESVSGSPVKEDNFLYGQLVAHVQVGVGRYLRGEQLSGHIFIKHYALVDALELLAKHVPAADKFRLDNLDPLRRFEIVYPELGAELNRLMLLETPQAALGLLDLVARTLPDYPKAAFEAVKNYLHKYGF